MSHDIDHTDAMIINLLRADGKLQNTDIARRLGVSEATVRKRIARLLREGIIRHFVWAEPLKVGYSHYVTVDIQATPGHVEAVADHLAKMKEISFVGICFGTFDVRVSIFGRSLDHIHEILLSIGKIKGIQRTTTTSVTKVVKRDYNFLIEAPSGGRTDAGEGDTLDIDDVA